MTQNNSNGFLQFSAQPLITKFSDLLTAKVGAVPSSKFACMDTWIEGERENFVHSGSVNGEPLVSYNLEFDWIRPWTGERAQIFVNAKTRSNTPFFCLDTPTAWDGSMIGLFPTDKAKSEFCCCQDIVNYLNSLDWFELGCEDASGRKCFSVGVFGRLMLP